MLAPRLRLLVIGDIAWDVVLRPEGALVWGSDVYGSTDLFEGGSSANVAVWARRLGADVTLVGKVGDDKLGELMLAHLAAEGIASHVTVAASQATTRVGIVIRPDGEHAFVTDHTRPLRLGPDDLPPPLLDGIDAVFLNGYAVFMAGSAAFARVLLDHARACRVPIAFDPASFSLVRRYGGNRLLDELGPLTVLLGNEEELQALSGGSGIEALLDRAQARAVVVKQGPRGAAALVRDGAGVPAAATDEAARSHAGMRRHSSPAVAVDVVDTTGAGDAFDAAFLVEYVSGADIERALAVANLLGSRVAGCLGAQTASYRAGMATERE